MFSVLAKRAVHECWVIADLYERQTCLGVTVVTQGSSSVKGKLHALLLNAAVQDR